MLAPARSIFALPKAHLHAHLVRPLQRSLRCSAASMPGSRPRRNRAWPCDRASPFSYQGAGTHAVLTYPASSLRTIAAPSASAFSFIWATIRASGFIPQSVVR
jgi:hypothetical protein